MTTQEFDSVPFRVGERVRIVDCISHKALDGRTAVVRIVRPNGYCWVDVEDTDGLAPPHHKPFLCPAEMQRIS